jgi:hypothetical protein
MSVLISDPDDRPTTATLRIIGPDRTELVRVDVPLAETLNVRPDSLKIQLRAMMQFNNLPLLGEGDLEVYFDTETGPQRVGRLAIKFASQPEPVAAMDSSSASEQPPPETQSAAAPKKKARKRAPSRP